MYNSIINTEGLEKIDQKVLHVLENIGLKVQYDGFHSALEANGAILDKTTNIVKLPATLVRKTISEIKNMIDSGRSQFILNGIMSSKTDPKLQLKFAGASIEYLDPFTNEVREPTEKDLIHLVKLGESIPEVTYVGNPVCYIKTSDGKSIPPNLQRVLTAALVGKYTTKYGSNEVWNDTELELLIELGTILRGGKEEYFNNPCFVTAKETISPLFFPEEDGKILYMLAEKGLPCTIIPMPISGVTSPVTVAGNIVMTAAEVLGVMTCIHCCFPDAMVAGGVISGIMDMKSGSASFAAPEAIIQDYGVAMLFEKIYGQDFGMGTGYIDALYPGTQSAVEIYAKMHAAYETGRYNYSCGLLLAGKRWSPVQALICIEIAKYIHSRNKCIDVGDDFFGLDAIENAGIGGSYLGEEHTLKYFREELWKPELIQRQLTQNPAIDEIIEKAKDTWADFEKNCDLDEYAVNQNILNEIENWKMKAIKILS